LEQYGDRLVLRRVKPVGKNRPKGRIKGRSHVA
jgi:hypothetical protein